MAPTLTSQQLSLIVIAVILGVIAIATLLFALQRLRRRKAQLLDELKNPPELASDRAFNRIAMARREADLLSRQGNDVGAARQRIAEAQAAFDGRHFERAYQSAQVAHESLVHARRADAPLPTAPNGPAPSGHPVPPSPAPVRAPTVEPTAGVSAPPTTLPIAKNRAESRFQLNLLDQELETARHARPDSPTLTGAADLGSRAHAAFDRSDFAEAFRLALKGRRALGGPVESLPLVSGEAPSTARGNGEARRDATIAAETVASATRCPDCGHPMLADDAFCRGCGRPRGVATCAKCGTARRPGDTFCGRCGAPFD